MLAVCLKSGFIDNKLAIMHFREHPIIQSYHNESLFGWKIAYLHIPKNFWKPQPETTILVDWVISYFCNQYAENFR